MIEGLKSEENLNVAVAFRLFLPCNRLYVIGLHLDSFRSDDEGNKAESLHIGLAF
jgi:hypothetical protein